MTKDPIAIQEENARQAARSEVFQDADHFEDSEGFTEEAAQAVLNDGGFAQQSINEYAAAMDKDGNVMGYVITVTTHEGYGGDIKFTIGVREDGTLNGMSILSISETPGLGMKAEEVLKPQFEGKKPTAMSIPRTELLPLMKSMLLPAPPLQPMRSLTA